MAQTQSKETLVRLAWLTELRRQGHRQCVGKSTCGGNTACALYLLKEVSSSKAEWFREESYGLAGLDCLQASHIISLNDGHGTRKHTFAEIADVVAGWFPS